MRLKKLRGKTPSVNLAINNSRIKKYGKKTDLPIYYLEKGQEFQIELYNPTQGKVLAKIKLNNNIISGGGLILRPGERVFLDRFIETNRKFLFDTYQVDGESKSARKAIELNGDLEVEFFEEYIPKNRPNILIGGSGQITGNLDISLKSSDNVGIGISNPTITNYSNDCTTLNLTDQNITLTSTEIPTLDTLSDVRSFASTDVGGVDFNGNISGTLDLGDALRSLSGKSEFKRRRRVVKKAKATKSIETGRVEEGSVSDQKLVAATGKYKTKTFHVVKYKLLPKSQKELTSVDYYTKYCSDCGGKCKTKFCPFCGARQ